MRVNELTVTNYKALRAVNIRPDGHVVYIGGKNGQGKSSVLDAIYVALKGRAANPPRPVRAGEEKATIRLDMGDLVVTRTFTVKEGKPYTDTLKVENAEGFRAGNPQQMLDALLGEIGFDPFEFAQKDPKKQAATLLDMVPLAVDLDDLREADAKDYAARRDLNRDVTSLQAQVDAIPEDKELPEDAPDREALTERLASASATNTAIERERGARAARAATIGRGVETRDSKVAEAARLREQAERLDAEAADLTGRIDVAQKEFDALPALDEPVDAAAIQAELRGADAVLARIDTQRRRTALVARRDETQTRSDALTAAMAARAKARTDALSKAPMPVEGLGIAIDDKGEAYLTWEGLPFDKDQISTAFQLRVSTAIGMAANPQLRVLRIKDGSLLDEDSMAILVGMAEAEDFQLWVEVVGTGGTGIIMEAGAVRGTEEAAEQQEQPDAPTPDEPATPAKKNRKPSAPKSETLL